MIIKGNSQIKRQFKDRKHPNDAGLDIALPHEVVLKPGINTINLQVQVNIPAGYMGLLYVRSSVAKAGISAAMVPIDPGYLGDIHAFLVNNTKDDIHYFEGVCLVQLVVLPIAIANVSSDDMPVRGTKAFNSSKR